MKPNELMIGDWILTNKYPHKVTAGQIHMIDMDDTFYNEDNTEPIRLTEEILKVNGFIDGEGMAQGAWCFGDFRLSASCFGIFKKLKYVHELQHALRLCGLNELADNLKLE